MRGEVIAKHIAVKVYSKKTQTWYMAYAKKPIAKKTELKSTILSDKPEYKELLKQLNEQKITQDEFQSKCGELLYRLKNSEADFKMALNEVLDVEKIDEYLS